MLDRRKGWRIGGEISGQVITPSLPSKLTTNSLKPGTPARKFVNS